MRKTISLVAIILGLTACKGRLLDERSEAINTAKKAGWTRVKIDFEEIEGDAYGIKFKLSGLNGRGKKGNIDIYCNRNTNDCYIEN